MGDELKLIELFHQINRRLWHAMLPIVKAKQLSIAEMSVLMRLFKKGSCRVSDLAAMIGIPASTTTGILDRLEEQGLLTRTNDPADRRSVILTATAKVKEFMGDIMTPMENSLKAVLGKIPVSRVQRLLGDLEFMLDRLEQTEGAECKEKEK